MADPPDAARDPAADLPPEWPLHQRVAAAVLRAAAASLPLLVVGAMPFGVAGLLPVGASLVVGLGWLFLLERRDQGPSGALWRTPLAGLLAGATAPFAGLWTGSALAAGPAAGYETMGRFMSGEAAELPAMLWLGVVSAALLLPWTVARATSDRLTRHLAGGALSLLLAGLGAFAAGLISSGLAEVAQLGAGLVVVAIGAVLGVLVGLAGWIADRVAARLGVGGPGPDPQPPSSARVGLWLALLAGATWGASFDRPLGRRSARGELQAVQSLRTLASAQAGFQLSSSAHAFADSLAQLGQAGLIDELLAGGEKAGYVFRLVRVGERWCAAADPVTPGVTGERRFFTNDSGELWFTSVGPFPLDLERCEPPTHLMRLGGGT